MKEQDELIAKIKARLPEYMAQRGQVVGDRGKKLIRCINPSHRDSTPSMSYYPKNKTLRCFGCGKSYDIFDLIGIDYPACDSFPKRIEQACALFDLPPPQLLKSKNQNSVISHPINKGGAQVISRLLQPQKTEGESQDFTDWVKEKINAGGIGGNYFKKRGISQALCEKYHLFEWEGRAYLPVYRNGRCISYCARAVEDSVEPRYKNSSGPMGIFGEAYLATSAKVGGSLVITESIFDALTAEQCGYQAVALCGAGNVERFLRLCERHARAANTYIYIAAGDHDAAGERMNQALMEGLRAQGLACTPLLLPEKCKDVNEAYQSARTQLEEALSAAEQVDGAAYELGSAGAALGDLFLLAAHRAKSPQIATGIVALDRWMGGGLQPGLYTLGAASSIGKTSLLLQMADFISASGTDVLFFSLEMSKFELMAKSLSRIMRAHTSNEAQALAAGEIMRADITMNEGCALLLEQAVEDYRLGASRLFIREGIAEIGAAEIRAAVGEHVRVRGRKPVVMIDYLQILKPADVRASDKQNTDRAIVELKRISRDFDLPVFALSSFNRENYRNAVTMEAFKESGAVEYSSDLLLGLQLAGTGESGFDLNAAKTKEPREVELVLLKNRSGCPYGKIKLQYYAKYSKFVEIKNDFKAKDV